MLRRFNVSARVRMVLIIPMVVLVAAGVYIGYSAFQQLMVARANASVVEALAAYQRLGVAVQEEQDAPEGEARREARKKADASLADFGRKADAVTDSWLPSQAATQFDMMRTEAEAGLATAREFVDEGARDSVQAPREYQKLLASNQSFVRVWADLLEDRSLAQWAYAHDDVLTLSIAIGVEIQAGEAVLGSVSAADPESTNYVAGTNIEGFTQNAQATDTAKETADMSVGYLGKSDLGMSAIPSDVLALRSDLQGVNTAASVDAEAWKTQTSAWQADVAEVDGVLLSGAQAAADQRQQAALLQLGITGAALLLGLLVAWIVARQVSRSITTPLSHLTEATGAVRDQLPKIVEQVSVPGEGPDTELPRVPVESDDEIGRLATAFNDVNATTIQVAQEQAALRGSIAEMFVNVARRDQVLLNRQLAFVDSLERSEEDPTVLANLFHLDHLATRMRRNAESLLVLAGIDSGRRLRESMPLSDVIRTASSEIEQYDRVELDLNVDPLMLGFNALPAAHMLAELLENASVFSEPDTPVEVSTGMDGQFVTVTVLDHGIGMTDSELASVNEKLRSTSPTDALGAQRLGLFVVSRLARRLGADVQVQRSSQGSGTETVVRFPVALFAGLETSQAPAGVESFADFEAPASPAYQDFAPEPLPAAAYASEGFSASVQDAYAEQEAPLAREVDLAALTDGQTDHGLPRRRSVDDEAFVLPPAVQAHDLPTDIAPAVTGFTPTMASGTGLPSRRQAAEPVPVVEPMDFSSPAPVDPEARQSLFSGFRGWSRTQNAVQEEPEPSFAEPRPWEVPAEEPVTVSATGGYAQSFDETVGQTRRGRHSHDGVDAPTEVPYGHTQSEVAAWHTGPIPSAEPADDSDWPSATWDTAPWQTGLFADNRSDDGSMVPTFDPQALEGEPYYPTFDADQAPAAFGQPPVQPAFETAAPAWATSADEPAWQPVMDLSSEPLAPADAGQAPPEQGPWSWPAAVEPDPSGQPAQWPAEPAGQWPQPEPAADWSQPRSAAEWSQWSPEPAQPQAEPASWQSEPAQWQSEPAQWQPAAPAQDADWAQPGIAEPPASWEAEPEGSKRKRGLWGRKKSDDAPDAVGADAAAPQSTWQPGPESAAPAATGWAPDGATPVYVPTEPVPAQGGAPSEGSRMNLDDDVAAMLALRSDIEEQALAELSQLSAYRPSMGGSGERLTRRVPTAVPDAVPGAGATPIRRDADELRSRLASFQSGTSRGRRASVDTKERDA
ncbi:MAG: ATP-binding protein [Micrococcales bacterium]|nr:ATP-binding protein [Micrococcales bacterium]